MPHTFGRLVRSLPEGERQEFVLSKARVQLGRASTNDIVVDDPKASREHAILECGETGCKLVDLGSSNGTRINGNRVERAQLQPGDTVAIGAASFRFEPAAAEPDPDLTRIAPDEDLDTALREAPLLTKIEETRGPRLVVHTSAKTWEVPFTGDSLTIGRQLENDIVLNSQRASRRHARIERSGDSFILTDLDTGNGTWIRGQRVTRHVLQEGDSVRIGGATIVFKRGFVADDLTAVEWAQAGAAPKRRPVVVVPGFAGSALWRGNEQIWPRPRMILSQPEILMDPSLEARGLVNQVIVVPNLIKLERYSLLVDYLKEGLGYEQDKDLIEFGYDFRQDIRESAKKLAAVIEGWGQRSPITIVAHSMGCLVTRYYVERLGGKRFVERLVLIGGPHAGTPYSFASLLRGPSFLPFGMHDDRLRQILASFPAWYQILPTYPFASDGNGQPLDVLEDESWVPPDRRAIWRLAREFRTELGTECSVPVVCIFGYGLKTITAATVERAAGGLIRKFDLLVTPGGDATIPEPSAVIENAEIHPVQQYHGTLFVDNDVKMRLKLELTRAATAHA